jgi:hypothetical protein
MVNAEASGNLSVGGNLAVGFNVAVGGNVTVTGDIQLADRDIAERFAVERPVACPPGTVMVIGETGALVPCQRAYDKRAVGVVSGAGTLRTAITLGATTSPLASASIALVGTAYCLVDADIAPIEIGDLVTTSDTIGHGMKAMDTGRSFGAIIGKALAPLSGGRGVVPILLALQ